MSFPWACVEEILHPSHLFIRDTSEVCFLGKEPLLHEGATGSVESLRIYFAELERYLRAEKEYDGVNRLKLVDPR